MIKIMGFRRDKVSMQNYKEINGNDYVKDSRTTINETMRSIQSMNSGTVFPTTNLLEGMKCYRTDLKKTYTLTNVENNTWAEDDTASKLATARKINITGNATGAAAFDGSSDISINTTVNESKHAAAADNADKLGGYPLNTSATGGNWGTVPKVGTDGVIEVGKYIDWHATNSTSDYTARWEAQNNGTVNVGTINGSLNGNASTADTASMLQTTDGNGAIQNGKFYWVGKDGQPMWLWGSNTKPSEMYVYNPSNFHVAAANNDGDGANIANTYLKRSGGQMTGDLTFSDIGNVGTSNKISWSGSTDGADIYYQTTASGQGNLVLNLRDDDNCYLRIACNGAFKSYFSPSDGNFHGNVNGNADTATNATNATTAAACTGNSATATKATTALNIPTSDVGGNIWIS